MTKGTNAGNQNPNRPWTSGEIAFLRKNSERGRAWIANELGRTEASVRKAAWRNGISLRPAGERRGGILGKPRHLTLRELRSIGLQHPDRATSINVNRAHQALKDREAGKQEPICPACTIRPIQTTNGWCIPCWNSALEAEHRDETDRIKARRALDAARQEKRRARR